MTIIPSRAGDSNPAGEPPAPAGPSRQAGGRAPGKRSEILSARESASDRRVDTSLRPVTLSEYIGQTRLKSMMEMSIAAAKSRGDALDHVLFYGPPGLGKTTL